MQIDDELERKLAIAEANDRIQEKRYEETSRLLKIPFHLRIQEKGMKDILERVEDAQKWTMEKILKKRHKHLLKEHKDMFAEFFMEFLKGEYHNIDDFLYIDWKAPKDKKQLKPIWEKND